jgi:hypothetical protein
MVICLFLIFRSSVVDVNFAEGVRLVQVFKNVWLKYD